eukprot:TRINITY_DN1510_c0_g1_i3.p1 TRINITY_DN1510_c0_g1~~TRINITY_DN1510_c0_g1_i3.p1  ORF type:complete len:220 (+),score=49.82 TRINITY_DN1510_c0_g1_i3:40-699(+)
MARVGELHADVRAILLTHAHLDHTLAIGAVQRATNAKIYLHADDLQLYDLGCLQLVGFLARWQVLKIILFVLLWLLLQFLRFLFYILGSPHGELARVALTIMPPPRPHAFLAHNQQFPISRNISCTIIHTPGHTPGSICFHFPTMSRLLSGDTLFRYGVGRTDLPGGSHAALLTSITTRLLVLPANTIVIPGHGPETTIRAETVGNPFLQPHKQQPEST